MPRWIMFGGARFLGCYTCWFHLQTSFHLQKCLWCTCRVVKRLVNFNLFQKQKCSTLTIPCNHLASAGTLHFQDAPQYLPSFLPTPNWISGIRGCPMNPNTLAFACQGEYHVKPWVVSKIKIVEFSTRLRRSISKERVKNWGWYDMDHVEFTCYATHRRRGKTANDCTPHMTRRFAQFITTFFGHSTHLII